MIRTFCDRCGTETTGDQHGAINGIEDADDNGNGTNQANDCFDIICATCYLAWRAWMRQPSDSAMNDSPELYDVARQVCHDHGLTWRDPRTRVTYPPPGQPASTTAVDPSAQPSGTPTPRDDDDRVADRER